jgi:hypothetical protein
MKCKYSENEIALFVEGDVSPAAAWDIGTHLETCGSCRHIADGLRESQALLKSLRQDTVSASALSSVRTRVLAEINGRPFAWSWGRWIYALAGAAFLIVLGLAIASQMPQRPAPVAKSTVVAVVPEVASREPETTAGTPVHRVARRPARRAAPERVKPAAVETPPEPKPLVVKLLTDDPNIVIYWLVDNNKTGGSL